MSYPVHLLEELTWSPSGEPEGPGTRINVVLLMGGVILFLVGGSQSSSPPGGLPTTPTIGGPVGSGTSWGPRWE